MDSTTTGTTAPHALNEASPEKEQTVREYYLAVEENAHKNLAGLEKARATASAKGLLDMPINALRNLVYPGDYPF